MLPIGVENDDFKYQGQTDGYSRVYNEVPE